MTESPRVTIVLPLFNDEEYVRAAIESCCAQTIKDIEIVAVDDASTDRTASIIEEYARRDPRIRLIRQPLNRSAFQARRVGVDAASAPFVLFLDGDDELAPNAAEVALNEARRTGADVVGFGVDIIAESGVPTRLAASLQPRHDQVGAPLIVPSLFPPNELPQGHIWRYLFSTQLLLKAYEGFTEDLAFYRANDLPITFLALAHAKKYASTPDRLYRYHFRRGTSGHVISDLDQFRFLLSGIRPITAIASRVKALAAESLVPDQLLASYESARLQVIGTVLRYCERDTSGNLRDRCKALVEQEVGPLDMVRAAATIGPEVLHLLTADSGPPASSAALQSVLLTTRRLDTGGLQAVVLDQARQLAAAGYRVTLAVTQLSERDVELPTGVTVVHIDGSSLSSQLDRWVVICREFEVDVIIDHYLLYNESWPWFALAGRALGISTIGWVHSFALRPIFDQTRRVSFIAAHAPVLKNLVTLSPTDVTFWKLRGVDRAVYLPNPLSPLALEALEAGTARALSGGRLELAWWGRLDRAVKQVDHLIDAAERLHARGVDFRLRIIGPDSGDLTAAEVRQDARTRGLDKVIELVGDQSSAELLATLRDADLFVSTSAIEGFQLTIIEAQALGIPVVMYDLPWLATVRNNRGLIATPPGDPSSLADAIIEVAQDPQGYAALSRGARDFAHAAASVDVGSLTLDLLSDRLSGEFSPEPDLEHARTLVDWLVRTAERNTAGGETDGPRAEIIALRRERDRARHMLRQVMEGPSFRIGRAVTRIPRKARDLLRPKSARNVPLARAAESDPHTPPPPLRAPADAPAPTRSKNPDVTFVIPVYNSAPWLRDCLSSVLAQSEVSVEVICIDDGSTDSSLEILRRFAASDPRVSVLEQANSGQSVGRNRGLDAATGRYLIYVDSDDYWPFDVLAALVARADAEQLDVLLFDCAAFLDGHVDPATWRWYSTYYQRAHAYSHSRSGIELMVDMRRNKEYRPHVGLYISRTDFVRRSGIRFIPGIVHQDNPYTFRLLLNAERAAHQRVDAYARRIRPGSTITTLTDERSARGYFLSYLQMVRALGERKLPRTWAQVVGDIVDSVYKGARKRIAVISPEAIEDLRALDRSPQAQAVLDSLIVNRS